MLDKKRIKKIEQLLSDPAKTKDAKNEELSTIIDSANGEGWLPDLTGYLLKLFSSFASSSSPLSHSISTTTIKKAFTKLSSEQRTALLENCQHHWIRSRIPPHDFFERIIPTVVREMLDPSTPEDRDPKFFFDCLQLLDPKMQIEILSNNQYYQPKPLCPYFNHWESPLVNYPYSPLVNYPYRDDNAFEAMMAYLKNLKDQSLELLITLLKQKPTDHYELRILRLIAESRTSLSPVFFQLLSGIPLAELNQIVRINSDDQVSSNPLAYAFQTRGREPFDALESVIDDQNSHVVQSVLMTPAWASIIKDGGLSARLLRMITNHPDALRAIDNDQENKPCPVVITILFEEIERVLTAEYEEGSPELETPQTIIEQIENQNSLLHKIIMSRNKPASRFSFFSSDRDNMEAKLKRLVSAFIDKHGSAELTKAAR